MTTVSFSPGESDFAAAATAMLDSARSPQLQDTFMSSHDDKDNIVLCRPSGSATPARLDRRLHPVTSATTPTLTALYSPCRRTPFSSSTGLNTSSSPESSVKSSTKSSSSTAALDGTMPVINPWDNSLSYNGSFTPSADRPPRPDSIQHHVPSPSDMTRPPPLSSAQLTPVALMTPSEIENSQFFTTPSAIFGSLRPPTYTPIPMAITTPSPNTKSETPFSNPAIPLTYHTPLPRDSPSSSSPSHVDAPIPTSASSSAAPPASASPCSSGLNPNPAALRSFFEQRSAHLSSPIFSLPSCSPHDLSEPVIRANPLAKSSAEAAALPTGISPLPVADVSFSLVDNFGTREQHIDLGCKAARVPIPYSIGLTLTDMEGPIRPISARLDRLLEPKPTIFLSVISGTVSTIPADEIEFHDAVAENLPSPNSLQRALSRTLITFWAAPDTFMHEGSGRLLLTVTDCEYNDYELPILVNITPTEPKITVLAPGDAQRENRKETNVSFADHDHDSDALVTVWNETEHEAPLLVNVMVEESAGGAFSIGVTANDSANCFPFLILAGCSQTFRVRFEVQADQTIRRCYYGSVLIKNTVVLEEDSLPGQDLELHQFYDHLLNLRAVVNKGEKPEDPRRASIALSKTMTSIRQELNDDCICSDFDEHEDHACSLFADKTPSPDQHVSHWAPDEDRVDMDDVDVQVDSQLEEPVRMPSQVLGGDVSFSGETDVLDNEVEIRSPSVNEANNSPTLPCMAQQGNVASSLEQAHSTDGSPSAGALELLNEYISPVVHPHDLVVEDEEEESVRDSSVENGREHIPDSDSNVPSSSTVMTIGVENMIEETSKGMGDYDQARDLEAGPQTPGHIIDIGNNEGLLINANSSDTDSIYEEAASGPDSQTTKVVATPNHGRLSLGSRVASRMSGIWNGEWKLGNSGARLQTEEVGRSQDADGEEGENDSRGKVDESPTPLVPLDNTEGILKTTVVSKEGQLASRRPKLKLMRSIHENGCIEMAADCGTVVFPVLNASSEVVEVSIKMERGRHAHSDRICSKVEPDYIVIAAHGKANITMLRTSADGGKHFVVLRGVTMGAIPLKKFWRVPVHVAPSAKRLESAEGVSVDRPTMSFYNPEDNVRDWSVRIRNGTNLVSNFRSWIGEGCGQLLNSHSEPAFRIVGDASGIIEPQHFTTLRVSFDGGDGPRHFHARINIHVGQHRDFMPLFGYTGSSDLRLAATALGYVGVRNFGTRAGFIVITGPECDAMNNTSVKAVLAPGEEREFVAPYGSGSVLYTGDEIARSRARRAEEIERSRVDETYSDEAVANVFAGEFEGEDAAAQEEMYDWDGEDRFSMFYSGRLLDYNARRYVFDLSEGEHVSFVETNKGGRGEWTASVEDGYVHIENLNVSKELYFEADGTEPGNGIIAALGDAMLAAFREEVEVRANGDTQTLTVDLSVRQ